MTKGKNIVRKRTEKERERKREKREKEGRNSECEEGMRWKKDVVPGTRRWRKAVLLMGPLSGLAALCDLQLKSSPSMLAPCSLLTE